MEITENDLTAQRKDSKGVEEMTDVLHKARQDDKHYERKVKGGIQFWKKNAFRSNFFYREGRTPQLRLRFIYGK